MRIIVCTQPPRTRGFFSLKNVAKPVPKDNEVLVHIPATTPPGAGRLRVAGDPTGGRLLDIGAHAAGVRHPQTEMVSAGSGMRQCTFRCRQNKRGFLYLARGRVTVATSVRPPRHPPGAYVEYIPPAPHPPHRRARSRTMPANLDYAELRPFPTGEARPRRSCGRRTSGAGQSPVNRSGRGLRHVRGRTRQGPRGSRDRGGQCAEAGDAAHDRCGSRHRLRPRSDFTNSPETHHVYLDVVRNTPSGRMVRLLTENGWLLMAIPASCRSFAPGGRRGGARAAVVRASGADSR